jgi:hypothetical protein
MITVRAFPHWLQQIAAAFAPARQPAIAQRAAQATPHLTIIVSEVQGVEPTALLWLRGAINHRTYLDLIAAAQQAYKRGARHLLLDLHDVNELELSGLFALHSIARLFAGASLLDPECGWRGLRATAENFPGDVNRYLKLIQPSPVAEQALQRAGLHQLLDV